MMVDFEAKRSWFDPVWWIGSVGIEFFLGFHFSLFQKFCFIS